MPPVFIEEEKGICVHLFMIVILQPCCPNHGDQLLLGDEITVLFGALRFTVGK